MRPGWVREPDGREEELRVTLDWGTDEETGQQWLRVTDNGVGMTEELIKRYRPRMLIDTQLPHIFGDYHERN